MDSGYYVILVNLIIEWNRGWSLRLILEWMMITSASVDILQWWSHQFHWRKLWTDGDHTNFFRINRGMVVITPGLQSSKSLNCGNHTISVTVVRLSPDRIGPLGNPQLAWHSYCQEPVAVCAVALHTSNSNAGWSNTSVVVHNLYCERESGQQETSGQNLKG